MASVVLRGVFMTNNGKIQDRINKKTGKQQYKCLVKWKDQNGKWHTTRTGWFDTEAKAIKESARLKRLHEEEAIESKENFQNKRIDELFDEYILAPEVEQYVFAIRKGFKQINCEGKHYI